MRIQASPARRRADGQRHTEPYAPPDPDRVYTLAPDHIPGGLGPHKWCDRRLLDGLSSPGSVPLLVEADGDLLEAAWANVWILEGDRIVTPAADGRILPGVTRELLLARAESVGLTAVAEPISLDRARAADAVFLTSSLRLAATPRSRAAPPARARAATIGAIRTALQAVGWKQPPAPR